MVHLLALTEDETCFKVLTMGKVKSKRYSHRALKWLRKAKSWGGPPEAKAALGKAERERRAAA